MCSRGEGHDRRRSSDSGPGPKASHGLPAYAHSSSTGERHRRVSATNCRTVGAHGSSTLHTTRSTASSGGGGGDGGI
eukprot:6963880-Prymnesium_polylepis.1